MVLSFFSLVFFSLEEFAEDILHRGCWCAGGPVLHREVHLATTTMLNVTIKSLIPYGKVIWLTASSQIVQIYIRTRALTQAHIYSFTRFHNAQGKAELNT